MAYEMKVEDGIVIFQIQTNKVSSISLQTLRELVEVIEQLNTRDDLKGLILTGTDKYFSGGFDLNEFTSFEGPQAIVDWFKYEEEALLKLFTCSKPVVAALNGHATAAGMIVTMACDWRMAINSPKVRMGMTEIKLGLALSPAEAILMRWGLDTEKKYRDIIFKGELISVVEAAEKEILDELADDPAQLIERAKAKISSLIDQPGRSFIELKRLHRESTAAAIRAGIDAYDWNRMVTVFTDVKIVDSLKAVKAQIGI